jgi:hypothetical protein
MDRLVARMVLLVVVLALVMRGIGALMKKENFDMLVLYLL